ncbi:MAG TPA: peptide ABC transporter substrate-binding protein [Anaerolineales bacterium]|nr:peptide ABC transporter substrate-binding protein [Anaerolineales bacterium]
MFSSKKLILVLGVLVIASLLLAACQPAGTPQVIEKTVIVTEIVEGEPVEVVQVVTPTPEPAGPRTLVICLGQEPDTLYIYGGSMLAASQVQNAIYEGPNATGIENNSFGYQPVILEKLPSLADGDAVINAVDVAAGDRVMNETATEVVELAAGVKVRPAGCRSADCAVEYDGTSALQMDQMAVTFKMLPGLLWSDGTPLKASDSVYSFNLALDPDTPNPDRFSEERTASYEATDDVTAVWTGLPGLLDATYFVNFWGPLPEHVYGQFTAAELVEAPESHDTPLGYGPYVIDEWVKGDNISAHKNPNYFRASEGLPVFDNLVFRIMGENSNANLASLLAGDCDVVDQTSHLDDQSELLLELQSAGQIAATFVTGTTWEHADFNIRPVEGFTSGDFFAAWDSDGDGVGPFGDVRLRQAVLMCMDRQAVVDTVMFGQSQVIHTFLPPQHPVFNANAKQWPFDVAAGSALLDEIGWVDDDANPETPRVASGVTGVPDGTLLEFSYETTSATQRMAATQVLAQSMAQCGFKVNLNYFPASEWFADPPDGKLFGRRYDLGQFAWLTGVEPPCNLYLGSEIPTEATGWAGQNNTGYSNPEYDEVCNAAIQSLPGEPSYEEQHLKAQEIWAQDLPAAPLYLRLKLAATRPDFCNFIMDPTNNSEMWNIEEFDYGECAGG